MERDLLERENNNIQMENKNTWMNRELKGLRDKDELASTKLRALERFSSELQAKHDKVLQVCKD